MFIEILTRDCLLFVFKEQLKKKAQKVLVEVHKEQVLSMHQL